jgi:predicted lipid-binding transport protein (Tim44 family)
MRILMKRVPSFLAAVAVALAFMVVAVEHADARRAGSFGSFGSRGTRTYDAPAATQTAPNAAPIQRSMTPRNENPAAARPGLAAPQRPGFFGSGFGGSLMRGLLIGGLIGMLLGHGLGGMAGILGLVLQIGLAMIVATLVMRWFANRQARPAEARPMRAETATAGGPPQSGPSSFNFGMGSGFGSGGPAPSQAAEVDQRDLDAFEQLLTEVQTAYGREDYAGLRERTTPEVMSYLSEELGQNATKGVRNEVSDVKLLQGDVSEAWREGDDQYATVAMRYESRDAMRDRKTEAVVSGDRNRPTEATELWTFVRRPMGNWKVSAIQEA